MRLLIFGLILFSSNVFGQTNPYHKFELDPIRIGYANAFELEDVKSGLAFGTEVRYNFRNHLSLGLSADFCFYFTNISGEDVDIYFMYNNVISIDKYSSSTSEKRAFWGIGIGHHGMNKMIIRDDETYQTLNDVNSFGFSARLGYEWPRVRFKAQYNLTTQKEVSNYLTLNFGVTLWGGKKKP